MLSYFLRLSVALVCTSFVLAEAGFAKNGDVLGVVAKFEDHKRTCTRISKAVSTQNATQLCEEESRDSGNIYFLDRKKSQNYHVTLELLEPNGKTRFSEEDTSALHVALQSFSKNASCLKRQNIRQGNLYQQTLQSEYNYDTSTCQLALFTHTKDEDGNIIHKMFSVDNIHRLPEELAKVSWANLVLCIGNDEDLADDWGKFRKSTLFNSLFLGDENEEKLERSQLWKSTVNHNLKPHVTIANFYKYDGNIYKFNKKSGNIENKYDQREKVWNKPFDRIGELWLLVNAFWAAHCEFEANTEANTNMSGRIDGLKIDALQMTRRDPETRTIHALHSPVRFSAGKKERAVSTRKATQRCQEMSISEEARPARHVDQQSLSKKATILSGKMLIRENIREKIEQARHFQRNLQGGDDYFEHLYDPYFDYYFSSDYNPDYDPYLSDCDSEEVRPAQPVDLASLSKKATVLSDKMLLQQDLQGGDDFEHPYDHDYDSDFIFDSEPDNQLYWDGYDC